MTRDNISEIIMDASFKIDDLVDTAIENVFEREYTTQICFNTQVIHRNMDESINSALHDYGNIMLHSD